MSKKRKRKTARERKRETFPLGNIATNYSFSCCFQASILKHSIKSKRNAENTARMKHSFFLPIKKFQRRIGERENRGQSYSKKNEVKNLTQLHLLQFSEPMYALCQHICQALPLHAQNIQLKHTNKLACTGVVSKIRALLHLELMWPACVFGFLCTFVLLSFTS